MKTKKIVVKKSTSKVNEEKKSSKKIEVKKVDVKVQPQKSISRLVFKFLVEEKVLESDNRKEKFLKLLELVKKDFPNSKFQKTHFYWYVTRLKKQLENNLEVDHLVTLPKSEE